MLEKQLLRSSPVCDRQKSDRYAEEVGTTHPSLQASFFLDWKQVAKDGGGGRESVAKLSRNRSAQFRDTEIDLNSR